MPEDEEHPIIGPDEWPIVIDGTRRDRPLPSWFVAAFVAALVWCAMVGAVGIVLLIGGWYTATAGAIGATLAAGLAAYLTVRGLGRRRDADHLAALGAVALFVAFFIFAGAFHSEHLLIDRDPAVYITSGRWIARTHEMRPKTHSGPFAAAPFGTPNQRYTPDFFPMLPVLLAMGWSFGGDTGMLLVGPLLGALGLLGCYALASRLLGPRRALLVPVFLMLAPLQVWFARDAYSELVVQTLVLGGLWLYLEARSRTRWGVAALSGALFAAAALARVDALGIIAGGLLLVAAEWVRCDSDANPVRARRVVAAFGGALIVGTIAALAITHHVARAYIRALGAEYHELFAAFVAAIVGVVVVVVVHRVLPGIGAWFVRARYLFALAVAASTAVFVWAYFWRPEPARDLPTATPGRAVPAPIRNAIDDYHWSWSLHWFSAYFGVVALAVAFVGFALLASRARRGNGPAATVFLVVVPVAVLYIARPSITPDLPWAMRRYLPVVIPGIAIALVVALDTGWRVARSMRRPLVRAAGVLALGAVVVLVAVPTGAAALPFVRARAQHGALASVHDICAAAGNNSAVVVYGYEYLDDEMPDPIGAFCGVPVIRATNLDLPQLAQRWQKLGKRLLVVTAVPKQVEHFAAGAKVIGHYPVADDDEPQRVFEQASKRFVPMVSDIWVMVVPPGPK